MTFTRRTLLATGALAGVAIGPPSAASAQPLSDPFTLGVASGDPDHDGFVLWTRLAVEPLAEDGLGGMPNRIVPVQWQVAADERFRHIVRAGVTLARPESAHCVHIELGGLLPGREYFYRFGVG